MWGTARDVGESTGMGRLGAGTCGWAHGNGAVTTANGRRVLGRQQAITAAACRPRPNKLADSSAQLTEGVRRPPIPFHALGGEIGGMRLPGSVIWRYVVSAACLMGHHPMRGHAQGNREIAQSSRHRSSTYMSNPKAKRNRVIMLRMYPAMYGSLSGSIVPRTTRVREVRGSRQLLHGVDNPGFRQGHLLKGHGICDLR